MIPEGVGGCWPSGGGRGRHRVRGPRDGCV